MELNISLNDKSIADAVSELRSYARWIEDKAAELCERLATIGEWEATIGFSQAIYDGEKVYSVRVEPMKKKNGVGFSIIANGKTVLLLEFGAGVTYGYGHPKATDFGMGPGTYPNAKGHWNDPKGWWFQDDTGTKYHSYGNAPAMPMYNTAQYLRTKVEEVAREVFMND